MLDTIENKLMMINGQLIIDISTNVTNAVYCVQYDRCDGDSFGPGLAAGRWEYVSEVKLESQSLRASEDKWAATGAQLPLDGEGRRLCREAGRLSSLEAAGPCAGLLPPTLEPSSAPDAVGELTGWFTIRSL